MTHSESVHELEALRDENGALVEEVERLRRATSRHAPSAVAFLEAELALAKQYAKRAELKHYGTMGECIKGMDAAYYRLKEIRRLLRRARRTQ